MGRTERAARAQGWESLPVFSHIESVTRFTTLWHSVPHAVMFARSLKKRNSCRSVSKLVRGVYILTTSNFAHGAYKTFKYGALFLWFIWAEMKMLDVMNVRTARAALWRVKLWSTNTQHYITQVWYLSLKRLISDWCSKIGWFFCLAFYC